MKRSITVFVAFILAMSMFAGCAQQTPSETSAPTTSASASETESAANGGGGPYTIANVPKMVGSDWWERMDVGNKQFAEKTGNKVFQVGGTTSDSAEQLRCLEDVIAQNVDVINVIPNSPEACDPVLKKARDNGIVVISHEASNLENVNYDIEAFVNADYGAHLMDNLAKLMNEEGEYAIMVGALTMKSHQEWSQGAIARQKEAYPKMKLVTDIVEPGGDLKQGSYNKAIELMSAYPNLKGFIGMDSFNPPGIALAIEETGKAGKVMCTGTSLASTIGPYLKSGACQIVSCWDPAMAGLAMSTVGVKVKEGAEITKGMDLGVPGYENINVDGKVIYGNAWIDIDLKNMDDYNF